MKFNQIAIIALSTAILTSCSSKRDTLSYFQDIKEQSITVASDVAMYEPKIEPLDELAITVTSERPQLTLPYNLPLTNPAAGVNGFITQGTMQQATYFVSPEGYITMPVIGKIHVAGLTTQALADFIAEKVSVDVEDPVVVVNLLNFKVNVGGEVASPGQYKVNGHRFSILDALSAAGDLTPYGKRENVLLIREVDGNRETHVIDLTSADILNSPYFYLKQNDYIYVSPNEVRNDNAKYNQNNAYKLTVVSTVVSAASIIASLVIALTVK